MRDSMEFRKTPVQQGASAEGRAALSVERAWQSWRGDLGELPRQPETALAARSASALEYQTLELW